MKRLFDILFSLIGIIITAPLQLIVIFLVWVRDKSNPLYIANRVGIYGMDFKIFKIRTMEINADKCGIDSTSENDPRITKIGSIIRKYKIDELPQLFNILIGNMSFVGPRPGVRRDIVLFTKIERKLLEIKPGLTDFASIVYSDESLILKDSIDPDLTYHQLIRPGKSRLGLFYVDKKTTLMDIALIIVTILSLISRKLSLRMVCFLLRKYGASKELVNIASRKFELVPKSPPGSDMITKSRNK